MSFNAILRSRTNRNHFEAAKEGRKAFTVRAYVRKKEDGTFATSFGNAIHCGPLSSRSRPAPPQKWAHAEAYRVRVIPK